jgi:hypothetical protein
MAKVKKAKYVSDSELSGVAGVSHLKQVVDTEEQYKDILKDAVVTRVANKGDSFITQNVAYNVLEIEADYDFPVYKYIFEGKEYFSNFQFANYVEIVNPQTIN